MKRKRNWLNHIFNFLAVILGVYLAFFINERAQLNQDQNESAMLMNSLLEDLSDDITAYEQFQIPVNTQYLQNVQTILNLIMSGQLDIINEQLPGILSVENLPPTTSTYSSMKASGKLGLIQDLELQKQLSDYYEGLVIESTRKGEYQVDYFTNEILTWLTLNVDLAEMKILNTEELTVLQNKLIIYGSLIEQKIESYEMVVENSSELKSYIESILEST
jgi:hypothetical protein